MIYIESRDKGFFTVYVSFLNNTFGDRFNADRTAEDDTGFIAFVARQITLLTRIYDLGGLMPNADSGEFFIHNRLDFKSSRLNMAHCLYEKARLYDLCEAGLNFLKCHGSIYAEVFITRNRADRQVMLRGNGRVKM